MVTNPCPVGPFFHPAPCFWPGRAVQDDARPWDPILAWETWKKFLAPGFGSAASTTVATWGGTEQTDDLSVSPPPVCVSHLQMETNKS